jgi:hypothetical protein
MPVPHSAQPPKGASLLSAYNNPVFGLLFDLTGGVFHFDGSGPKAPDIQKLPFMFFV